MDRHINRRHFLGAAALAIPAIAAGCRSSTSAASSRVVMYCAQDREFAEDLLADFTKSTGIEVAPKYDTEADKSVSIKEELIREKERPRCDVHWNNENLHTIRLGRLGMLEPYESPSAKPYPDSTKAADHTWQAFATRARVLLVGTRTIAEKDRPRSLLDLTDPRWKGKVAMAKPQFGTTATQAACLFEVLGPEEARKFYTGLAANEVRIVPGNKQAAEAVSNGEALIGMTDTDDAMGEVESGRPVTLVFPDREENKRWPRLGTLFIPNTLAIIKGSPNPDGGRRLIDFLLGADTEAKLAKCASHQIPLNPNVKPELPAQILTPRDVRPMAVDFEKAADLWEQSQAAMTKIFARD